MKVSIIGSGYVGLVTGACLAEMGNHVVCLDNDPAKVAALEAGRIPIYEPGLEALIERNVRAGRLRFTGDAALSAAHGVLQFIAVGTPPDEDGSADLTHVLAAARAIGRSMSDYKLVVNKSTVPVGTARRVREAVAGELASRGLQLQFSVASNPEFLKEGNAVADFMRPDRVIVGTEDDRALMLLRSLYAPFVRNRDRMLVMDIASAEFTKYAANAMLATRISFMNELAGLAEPLGADIELVRQGIGSDPRIGTQFLYAGAGYGGACFPKDVAALARTARDVGRPARILEAVSGVNDAQKLRLAEKVQARYGRNLEGCCFAMWGLAFKPNTDDMREAPSRAIISRLLDAGARIRAYDPVAGAEAARLFAGDDRITVCDSADAAIHGADALLIVTEWKEFRTPDLAAVADALRDRVIFDGRNLYEEDLIRAAGLEYHAIGRPSIFRETPVPAWRAATESHLIAQTS